MIWFSHQPDAFTNQLVVMLRQMYPAARIDVAGPRDLLVNGRYVGVTELFQLTQSQPSVPSDLVERRLRQLVETGEPTVPLATAQRRIMPCLRPHSDLMKPGQRRRAFAEYVNDTVIAFTIRLTNSAIDVNRDDLYRWRVSVDELDMIARDNLVRFRPEVEAQFIQSSEGGRLAVFATHDGYDAERILLDSLHEELCAELGSDFYVAVPARDMFFAFTMTPESFVSRVRKRFQLLYRTAPEPITSELFIVTRDGVAGTLREAV
jgi:hypothetical protein